MKTLLFLTFVALGYAVNQELVFHESRVDNFENSFTFRTHVPDSSAFPLEKVVRGCQNSGSVWVFYSDKNYVGQAARIPEPPCDTIRSVIKAGSFRFLGNLSTEVDAISLYPQTSFKGEEVYIGHSPFGGITRKMASLGRTGKSAWTLFEGANFQGQTVCLPPKNGLETQRVRNITLELGLATVGSVVKGCLTRITPELRETLQISAKHV